MWDLRVDVLEIAWKCSKSFSAKGEERAWTLSQPSLEMSRLNRARTGKGCEISSEKLGGA